ncbi:MAG: hypothetical protein HRT72_04770, partial [Flavobacteriales bacterium]|nr:hypothetical protein [Flavobacteriales bacterium]
MLKCAVVKFNYLLPILIILLGLSDAYSQITPSNNNCTSATNLCYSTPVNGTTIIATTECPGSEDCINGGIIGYPANNTIWYTFSSNSNGGAVSILISNIGGCTGANTSLQAALIEATIPCDISTYTVIDSNNGSSSNFSLTGNLNPNTVYYIQVDGDESTLPYAECDFSITTSGEGVKFVTSLSTTPTCTNSCDGTINASTIGSEVGSGLSYLWSNGVTSSSITECSGNFTVTITDSESCQITASTNLSSPIPLSSTTSVDSIPSCFQGSDGKASTITSGGTGAIDYVWSDGQTEATARNLSAGTYSLTTTDENSCTVETTVTVEDPKIIIPSTLTSDNDLCN